MPKSLYRKLSITILKNNKQSYIPFVLTCTGMVALYYIILALKSSKELKKLSGMGTLNNILTVVLFVVGIFALIFIFYTNSFLMKRRKNEFALYNMLGTQKKHLLKILAWENFYTALCSMTLGIFIGAVFYKIAESIFFNIIGVKIPASYMPDFVGIFATFRLFLIIFLIVYVNSAMQILFAKPINLLSSIKRGEAVPKVNLIYSVLGIVSLAIAYYLAATTKMPLKAMAIFFVAAVLVIIGTYICFVQVSILLLKILQKCKSFYYKTSHFTSISGLIFRIRQNAVGLANICILSTVVLVVVSAAVSFYAGGEEILRFRYPRNIVISADNDGEELRKVIDEKVRDLSSGMNITIANEYSFAYNSGFVSVSCENNLLEFDRFTTDMTGEALMGSGGQIIMLAVDDIKKYIDFAPLEQGQIYFSGGDKLECDELKIGDKLYKLNRLENAGDILKQDQIVKNYYLIFPSKEEVIAVSKVFDSGFDTVQSYIKAFDLECSSKVQLDFFNKLKEETKSQRAIYIESVENERLSFRLVYGGMFFSGILLGIVFMIAVVLIIYYKQLVEGYEDKKRFEIMQKVGMSKKEIKQSIRSQIITVFFLPLILSGVHLCFAFPVLANLLKVLNMQNTRLFASVCVAVYMVFSLIYISVYMLTSKTYYSIVVDKN